MKIIVFICAVILTCSCFSQNLLDEKVRRIDSQKKNLYVDSGIFHRGSTGAPSKLIKVRHSYVASSGYERVVFDFETEDIPKIYGHIDGAKNLIRLDLFATVLTENIDSFGKSQFVDSINFLPVDEKRLSLEMKLKSKAGVDIFYLKSPARLVLDIKKI